MRANLSDKKMVGRSAAGWVVVFLVFAIFLALAALPVYLIPFHVSRNYNEGWNAYHALAAMSGGILYPPSDSFISNNYPPLSFYLVGAFGQITGDYVVAGRLISLTSLLIVACNIFLLCRWIGADRMLASFGSALFLLAFCELSPDYVATDDPQLLGHAFITAGAVVFLNAARRHGTNARVVVSVLLICAGGLVKHNLVALPLALGTWVAIHDRRQFVRFLLAGLVVGVLALGALYALWGQAIVDGVLRYPRLLSWSTGVELSWVLRLFLPYIAFCSAGCVALPQQREIHFVIAYAIWSALFGFPLLFGTGVNVNVLDDFTIALIIGTVAFAMAVEKGVIRLPFGLSHSRFVVVVMLAMPLFAKAALVTKRLVPEYESLLRNAKDWSALADDLSRTDGPVACDLLAICYWAGKSWEIDFFSYGQKLFVGIVTDKAFRERIGNSYFAYIFLQGTRPSNRGLPNEVTAWTPKPYLPIETTAWLLSYYAPVRIIGDDRLLAPSSVQKPDSDYK
jgi:hypothetical protein